MSVMEADDRESGTVLHYAPRHVRLPAEERSIRPILERLSRGESDVRTDSQLEPVRVEHLVPLEAPRRKFGWQLIACSALSAGLSAGLAVLAIVWFAPGKPEVKTEVTRVDAARVDPKAVSAVEATQVDPKAVRTVSFKQDAPPAATTGVPAETALQKEPPEAAPPIQPKDAPPPSKAQAHDDHQIAPKELLALWSGVPADLPAAPVVEQADVPAAATPANVDDGRTAEAEALPPEKPHRAVAHPRRHAQVRHRLHAARAHAPRVQQQVQPAAAAASASANAAPPQSVFQSLFSRSAAGAQSGQQQQGY